MLEYELEGDCTQRIDPVAKLPNEFVQEWLEMPEEDAIRWSDVERPAAIEDEYQWWGPVTQCVDGWWQVRIDAQLDVESDEYYSTYYIVEGDEKAYRVREIRDEARPGCPEREATASSP